MFPLEIGKDYGSASFPTLALSRSELIPTFKPLAKVEGHLMTSSEYYLAGKFFICCREFVKRG